MDDPPPPDVSVIVEKVQSILGVIFKLVLLVLELLIIVTSPKELLQKSLFGSKLSSQATSGSVCVFNRILLLKDKVRTNCDIRFPVKIYLIPKLSKVTPSAILMCQQLLTGFCQDRCF